MADSKEISVLFIDDDSLFVDAMCHGMGEHGMACTSYAPSGALGLQMLEKDGHLPAIILLDITMPGMDGFEVLTKLKADPHTKAIPVIVFSNDATPENIERCKQLGAALFLEKVRVLPKEIVSEINKILHQ